MIYDQYTFVSEEAQLVYILTMLEGRQRNDQLGINDGHYRSVAILDAWFLRMKNILAGCNQKAMTELEGLYRIMNETTR